MNKISKLFLQKFPLSTFKFLFQIIKNKLRKSYKILNIFVSRMDFEIKTSYVKCVRMSKHSTEQTNISEYITRNVKSLQKSDFVVYFKRKAIRKN